MSGKKLKGMKLHFFFEGAKEDSMFTQLCVLQQASCPQFK